MLRDEAPNLDTEPDNSFPKTASAVGRILYERFLVASDITDPAYAGRFRSHVVTDLKNFCRPVVLKSLDHPSEILEDHSPSYQQLCNVIVQLKHPNIEELVETGKLYDDRPYSVSTLIEGERLSAMLKDGKRLDLEQAARILEALYEALAAAHSRNILHCDVNPDNVIVSNGDDRHIRLINFGLAWPVDLHSDARARAGTDIDPVHYTAPEMFVKLSHRSPASDVYSLAALAYRMLVGHVPFRSVERKELLTLIAAGEIEPPSEHRTDVRLETDRIILAGLGFESAWRPQDIEDFGSRLVLSLREKPVVRFPFSVPVIPVEVDEAESSVVVVDRADAIAVPDEKLIPHTRRISSAPTAVSDRGVIGALIILLLAGALSIPIGQNILSDGTTVSATSTMLAKKPENTTKRQLRYSMGSAPGVQQLTVSADTPGDFYILKEVATEGFALALQVVHTTNGAAAIEAGKLVKADLLPTKPPQTVKAVWIVWTAVKNDDLEALRGPAADGVTADETSRKVKHFLERNRDLRIEAGRDELTGQIVLTGTGDRMVHRITVDPN